MRPTLNNQCKDLQKEFDFLNNLKPWPCALILFPLECDTVRGIRFVLFPFQKEHVSLLLNDTGSRKNKINGIKYVFKLTLKINKKYKMQRNFKEKLFIVFAKALRLGSTKAYVKSKVDLCCTEPKHMDTLPQRMRS